MTLWLTNKPSKNPEKEGTNPPRSRRSPGPHSGQGRARSPVAHFGEITYSGLKSVAAKQKGKKKNKAREARKTLAASRPKKKASEGPRRIPKTRGAQKGTPRKTPRSRTHGQKGRNKKRGGTQKEKRNKQKSACGGVLLLPDLCLL